MNRSRRPTFRTFRTQALAILAALAAAVTPAAGQRMVDQQLAIDIVLAANAACPGSGGPGDNHLKLIIDASSSTDCNTSGTGNITGTTALCICDGGTLRAATVVELSDYAELGGAAFTGATSVNVGGGDIEVDIGEDTIDFLGAVTINGAGVPSSSSRTVRVDADATANGTTVFNTVKAAADYVATQTRSASSRWSIQVQGGGPYAESPFTIPKFSEVVCQNGGGLYFGGNATHITTSITSGTFITMQGGGIRNCYIEAGSNPTAARNVIECANDGFSELYCTLDHVGIQSNSDSGTNNDFDDILFYQSDGAADLYYVVLVMISNNPNRVGLKKAATADGATLFNNGWIVDGGGNQGIGVWSLATGTSRTELNNVRIGALYSDNKFTNDIVNDGTAVIYVSDSYFQRTSTSGGGTINVGDRRDYGKRTAPPNTCNADSVSSTYWDTDINSECTCNGTAYVLSHDMSTTTGCS